MVAGGVAPAAAQDLNPTVIRPAQAELPGYELLELLGRGGMGEVWRARQHSLSRMVAIKLLPENLSKNPEFIARFQKEATALASLSHPNIIQIIDRGEAGGQYFFVMEFVPGRSLRELLGSGRLSAAEALPLIAQICRAIDDAHAKGIIHRDLKPENILVDDRGHVKVADFGLAGIQAGAAELQLTATAVAMGTVNYMAPEQRRDARNVDGRADLYSLGVIFYELLTGELPLGRFKLPSEKVEGLDPRLDAIVARALEPDPTARPARASEIEAAIAPLWGAGGAVSPAPGPKATPARPAPDVPTAPAGHPAQGWRIGAAGIAVLGAIFLIVRLTGRPPQAERAGGSGAVFVHHRAGVDPHGHEGPGTLPPNTDAALTAQADWRESKDAQALSVRFAPAAPGQAGEPLHAHAGLWTLEDGRLVATQAGEVSARGGLVPRVYVGERFVPADGFEARVRIQLASLVTDFPIPPEAPSFAELAWALDGVQVALFADPRSGLRLTWRTEADGHAEAGSTERDVQLHVADQTFLPVGRPFEVRLTLRRRKDATLVEAFLDGKSFARKSLEGLGGEVGKVALGCRNLHCAFDGLEVKAAALTAKQRAQAERSRRSPHQGEQ
jgi:serine/threonine-protein kinase